MFDMLTNTGRCRQLLGRGARAEKKRTDNTVRSKGFIYLYLPYLATLTTPRTSTTLTTLTTLLGFFFLLFPIITITPPVPIAVQLFLQIMAIRPIC